jgi:hypothetical protein
MLIVYISFALNSLASSTLTYPGRSVAGQIDIQNWKQVLLQTFLFYLRSTYLSYLLSTQLLV